MPKITSYTFANLTDRARMVFSTIDAQTFQIDPPSMAAYFEQIGRADTSLIPADVTEYTLDSGALSRTQLFFSDDPVEVTIVGFATYPFSPGAHFVLVQMGAGQVSVVGDGESVIEAPGGLNSTAGQFSRMDVHCYRTDKFTLSGDLA